MRERKRARSLRRVPNSIHEKTIATIIAALACYSASAFEIETSVTSVDAGKIQFSLRGLPGVVTPGKGIAYTVAVSHDFGKFRVGAEAQYLEVMLKSVTLGGRPRNWGDRAQGYYAGAFVSYDLAEYRGFYLRPKIAAGYSDILGAAPAASVGLAVQKKLGLWNLGAGIERRRFWDGEHEGIKMRKDDATLYSFSVSRKF